MSKDNRWWTFAVVSLALFMGMLDNLVVTTALPTIQRAIGASVSHLEWIVNAYTLGFAVLMIPAAALGERFGRRRVLLVGVASVHRGLGARRAFHGRGNADPGPRRPGRRQRNDRSPDPHHPRECLPAGAPCGGHRALVRRLGARAGRRSAGRRRHRQRVHLERGVLAECAHRDPAPGPRAMAHRGIPPGGRVVDPPSVLLVERRALRHGLRPDPGNAPGWGSPRSSRRSRWAACSWPLFAARQRASACRCWTCGFSVAAVHARPTSWDSSPASRCSAPSSSSRCLSRVSGAGSRLPPVWERCPGRAPSCWPRPLRAPCRAASERGESWWWGWPPRRSRCSGSGPPQARAAATCLSSPRSSSAAWAWASPLRRCPLRS